MVDSFNARIDNLPEVPRLALQTIGSAAFVVPLLITLGLVTSYYHSLAKTADLALKDLHISLVKHHAEKKLLVQQLGLLK